MIEGHNLETYLSISPSKYGIYLLDKKNLKKIYQSEEKIDDKSINHESFTHFLDKNIFKIEKFTGQFLKNIFIIIENQEIFKMQLGVKKKNYEDIIDEKHLKTTLAEAKDIFRKNYKDQNLMHMIVNNYLIKGKNYTYFDRDLKTNEFCLVISFISIPNKLSYQLDKILEKKYQIKNNKYLHETYITNLFIEQEIEFPVMICKILNGYNENEVQLVPKNKENTGFFEKFFQLFS